MHFRKILFPAAIVLLVFMSIPFSCSAGALHHSSPSPSMVSPSEAPTQAPSPSPSVKEDQPEESRVTLHHRKLITVMADSGHTAKERAAIVEQRLLDVLQRARTMPSVRILILDSTPVMESEGVYIISVTNSDAHPKDTTVSELAATWRDALEKGIHAAWLENRADYNNIAIYHSIIAVVAGCVICLLVLFIARRLLKVPGFVMVLMVWLTVLTYILWIFPGSRPWGKHLLEGVVTPIGLAMVIAIVLYMLLKPADMFIERVFDSVEKMQKMTMEQNRRLHHRFRMLRILAGVGVKTVLIVLGFFLYVNSLKINLTTALAGAGVLGVGLGLATQDLLKDFVSGFFIVLEDQFAVGDVIRTSSLTGTVEDFTFRVTRLRDMEGKLITVPNSLIRTVENLSSGWSQVDFNILVSYGTKLTRVMEIMLGAARELREEWGDVFLEEPQMLGVEELGESGIRLRMIVKTVPLEQWRVRRELLLRIKNRFDEEGIVIPFPQHSVWLHTTESGIKPADADTAGKPADRDKPGQSG